MSSEGYIASRLTSKSLWAVIVVCIGLFAFSDYRAQTKFNEAQSRVKIAQDKLASTSFEATNKCNDNWKSSSVGEGTCSWHDGVNYDYASEIDSLKFQAMVDPQRSRDNEKNGTLNIIYILLVVAFLFGPLLDDEVFPKKKQQTLLLSTPPETSINSSVDDDGSSFYANIRFNFSLINDGIEEYVNRHIHLIHAYSDNIKYISDQSESLLGVYVIIQMRGGTLIEERRAFIEHCISKLLLAYEVTDAQAHHAMRKSMRDILEC